MFGRLGSPDGFIEEGEGEKNPSKLESSLGSIGGRSKISKRSI